MRLEQSECGEMGGGTGREGGGRSCRALWAVGELGLLPRGRWEPWRAWAEGGHNLTQMFRGALWWLPWGGQTGRPGWKLGDQGPRACSGPGGR